MPAGAMSQKLSKMPFATCHNKWALVPYRQKL